MTEIQRTYFYGGPGCMACGASGSVWCTWPFPTGWRPGEPIGRRVRCKSCKGTGTGGPFHRGDQVAELGPGQVAHR